MISFQVETIVDGKILKTVNFRTRKTFICNQVIFPEIRGNRPKRLYLCGFVRVNHRNICFDMLSRHSVQEI